MHSYSIRFAMYIKSYWHN